MKLHKFQKFVPYDWYEKALNDTKENTKNFEEKKFRSWSGTVTWTFKRGETYTSNFKKRIINLDLSKLYEIIMDKN